MTELKRTRAPKRVAPPVDRWILDVEAEEAVEVDFDPYGGRFGAEYVDYELEDSDFDKPGGHGLFGF